MYFLKCIIHATKMIGQLLLTCPLGTMFVKFIKLTNIAAQQWLQNFQICWSYKFAESVA